jgi:hypothetical protein
MDTHPDTSRVGRRILGQTCVVQQLRDGADVSLEMMADDDQAHIASTGGMYDRDPTSTPAKLVCPFDGRDVQGSTASHLLAVAQGNFDVHGGRNRFWLP